MTSWVYDVGGLLHIRAAVRKGRHDDVLRMGGDLVYNNIGMVYLKKGRAR